MGPCEPPPTREPLVREAPSAQESGPLEPSARSVPTAVASTGTTPGAAPIIVEGLHCPALFILHTIFSCFGEDDLGHTPVALDVHVIQLLCYRLGHHFSHACACYPVASL
jgi:hypothetical protein